MQSRFIRFLILIIIVSFSIKGAQVSLMETQMSPIELKGLISKTLSHFVDTLKTIVELKSDIIKDYIKEKPENEKDIIRLINKYIKDLTAIIIYIHEEDFINAYCLTKEILMKYPEFDLHEVKENLNQIISYFYR